MSGEPWLILPTYNEAENIEPIVRAASDVRSRCVSGQCPPSDQAYATSTERMANSGVSSQ